MKRIFLGLGILCALVVGVSPVAKAQNVNNFKIQTFEAEYYLDKDSEGRSTLKTVEKITAVFPESDQNHGLERAIPKKYDGHSTSLKIESIKDEAGYPLSYSEETVNDNLLLRIGDADTYVHGQKHYILTYIQRDVTRFFNDTNSDEFYWDVNGTQWRVPIEEVKATVNIAPTITSKLNGKASCYYGVEASTATCSIARNSDGSVFSASVTRLKPYENLTLAIGFQPQTFSVYQPSVGEKIMHALFLMWVGLQMLSIPAAIVAIILLSIRFAGVMHRAKGRNGTLTVEYLPPKNVSVLTSAMVLKNTSSDITAQLIDLAVRHYIKIYQTKEKTLFKAAEYELEIVKDISDLSLEEKRLLKNLFGGDNMKIGSRFAMKSLKNNTQIAKKLLNGRQALKETTRGKYRLFERADAQARSFRKFGFFALLVGIVTLSPLVVVTAIVAFVFSALAWPLTEKGAELRDYLAGLKEYISVAEADRIKMLQSPEGAEKVGVRIGENDAAKLVKLYERALPYAVLFGIEQQWTKQLGVYYETAGSQPDWYTGNAAFNAAIFSSAVHSFSTQSSSYSSATNSSSGGSSGGGSSGGGGGGGGGGGW